jgi:hypothetical protein
MDVIIEEGVILYLLSSYYDRENLRIYESRGN